MSLKCLIQNQRLRVDAHSRGEVMPEGLQGVHIHKSFYDGKRRGKEVRISIRGENIDFDRSFDDQERQSIVKEIRVVLERDRQKLLEFSVYVADALYCWSGKKVQIHEAQRYAAGIAQQFDLCAVAREEMIKRVDKTLYQYISVHDNGRGQQYIINQKPSAIIIRPGKSIKMKY